jgi:hypothetical protein
LAEICEERNESSSSVVSTVMIFDPASAACLSGGNSALESVGAMIRASGFFAVAALTIGTCWDVSNAFGPWRLIETSLAAACFLAPHCRDW